MALLGRRVKRTRKGQYQLRLPAEERDLLRTLPAQLRQLLVEGGDDPALRRLFPPAYLGEPEREAEYRQLMGDELLASRQAALDVMEATVDAEVLEEEQLLGWLNALNELRLVLGTRLDVTEDMYDQEVDPDDPRAPGLALYGYLSWLQEEVVVALSGSLPD